MYAHRLHAVGAGVRAGVRAPVPTHSRTLLHYTLSLFNLLPNTLSKRQSDNAAAAASVAVVVLNFAHRIVLNFMPNTHTHARARD